MNNESIGYGRTADVSIYDTSFVLKLFKPFMSKNVIEKEFKIASFAYSKSINTPKPVKMEIKENRIGIVYEKINGKSLLQLLSDNPMQLTRIARQMAKMHYQINSVVYDDKENKQKTQILNAIHEVSNIDKNDKDKIIKYLALLPDGKYLCHGDFHPDNILRDDKIWIIDWMTGSSGNPTCDVARSKVILETSEIPESVPFLIKYLLSFGQKKLAKTYIKEYCNISGLNKDEINAWLLPLYTARLVENLSNKETTIIIRRIKKEMKKKLTKLCS